MHADRVTGVIRIRAQGMIRKHRLQRRNRFRCFTIRRPHSRRKFSEQRVSAIGFCRMHFELGGAAENVKAGFQFLGDNSLFIVV